MRVEDTGGMKRLKGAFKEVSKAIPETIAQIGSEMALEASVRAPSPDVEYQTMMTGFDNPEGITNVPAAGETTSDKRMRFDKPSGFYLQPFISRNVQMLGPMTVGLGSIPELNVGSQYIWRNVDGTEHTSTFPFWECWEDGMHDGTFIIVPTNAGDSKNPKLSPAPRKENERVSMTKTIPMLRMYGGIDIGKYVNEKLIPAIRKIVKDA